MSSMFCAKQLVVVSISDDVVYHCLLSYCFHTCLHHQHIEHNNNRRSWSRCGSVTRGAVIAALCLAPSLWLMFFKRENILTRRGTMEGGWDSTHINTTHTSTQAVCARQPNTLKPFYESQTTTQLLFLIGASLFPGRVSVSTISSSIVRHCLI